MRHEGHRGHHSHHEGRHRGHHKEGGEGKTEGAKTFRRKRAVKFLEHLETKQAVLKKQLATPELQTANPTIVGELKATQSIIEEFVQLFELYEAKEHGDVRVNKETAPDPEE